MDKRTKILLVVLGALILLGGGYFGYIAMMAGDVAETVQQPVAQKAPEEQPVQAVPAEAPPPAPVPEAAETQPPQPAAPATEQAAEEGKAEVPPAAETPPGPDVKAAEVAAEEKPTVKAEQPPEAAQPAPCVPVIRVGVGGKVVEFKSPEEVMEKSGLDSKSLPQFTAKNLDEARVKLDGLVKSKGAKQDIDCAQKELEMAEKLAKLVDEKYPAKPVKEVYAYSSLDKRDPFMSPAEIPRKYPPVPANAPPLERVPSESLGLNAIMWNEKGFRALVFTDDGRGYTVKVGDTIGNKRGKIVRISEKMLYIEERIPDIFGDIEVRNIVLKLHKEAH